MTPQALKAARRRFGYTCAGLAEAVGVASGRTVRRWEAGTIPVPGPVARLLAIWLEQPALAPTIRRGRSPSEPVSLQQAAVGAGGKSVDDPNLLPSDPIARGGRTVAEAMHRHTWTPYTNGDVDWDECEECGAQANERPITPEGETP